MKRVEYFQHVRRSLLAEQVERVSNLSDQQLEAIVRGRMISQGDDSSGSSLDRALREAVNYKEVDQMIGIELPDEIDEIDLSDNHGMDPEELEDQIAAEFSAVTEMFVKRDGAACAISYVYIDPAGSEEDDDENNVRGHVLVFGDCRTLDLLIKQVKDVMKENAIDGIVSMPKPKDDDDDNDPMLDEINEKIK